MASVLIVTPDLKLLGGVALFYKGLKPYWSERVSYLEMAPLKRTKLLSYIFHYISNFFDFIKAVIARAPKVVVFNSSLKPGFYSNLIYSVVLTLIHKKYIVFIHGWDERYENYLVTKKGKRYIHNAESIIVLSSKFKDKLELIGIDSNKLYVTTTEVDNELIKGFDISIRNGSIKNFLFLARTVRGKGLFESLDIFQLLANDYPNIRYDIVGDGEDLEEAKQYVIDHNIHRVIFHGRKQGEDLVKFYSNADFFFFLSYTEGMPASLLEAMAFGLMIATRPVGAIPEVFKDGENGILSSELSPEYYYKRIKDYMEDSLKVQEIQKANHVLSVNTFLASEVAAKLESFLVEYATA